MKSKCLIILLVLIGFKAKPQSPFVKEFHYYNIDTTLKATVLYNNKFYCLKSNHKIFVIDTKTNTIDSSYSDNLKSPVLENLYIRKDSLMGQSRSDTYFLNKENKWVHLLKGYSKSEYFYEDDRFVVQSTCSGEWGGSLYFKDKSTSKIYECECTCAINVRKNNSGYLVTASLDHMYGFASVFEIADPLKLKKYDRRYLKGKKLIYVGEDESKSTKGTNRLIDSIGATIAASFNYNSKNYYLTEKLGKVSIDTIYNKKLIPFEDLTNLGIWAYYSENRQCFDQQISTFYNDKKTGFIDIDKNKLSFYIFDLNHN